MIWPSTILLDRVSFISGGKIKSHVALWFKKNEIDEKTHGVCLGWYVSGFYSAILHTFINLLRFFSFPSSKQRRQVLWFRIRPSIDNDSGNRRRVSVSLVFQVNERFSPVFLCDLSFSALYNQRDSWYLFKIIERSESRNKSSLEVFLYIMNNCCPYFFSLSKWSDQLLMLRKLLTG